MIFNKKFITNIPHTKSKQDGVKNREYKIKPEDLDITLFWIPTEKKELDNGDFSGFEYSIDFKYPIEVISFKTKRIAKSILFFSPSEKFK